MQFAALKVSWENKVLSFLLPLSPFFFFPPPENILLSLGARFKLAEVKEKFYPLVSMRRTSDTSVCMLQKHAFRP